MRHDAVHVREIDSVLSGASSHRDADVVASWKRCVGEYQLDPARPTEAYIVPDSQLREHRERSERLINIARESVEELFRQIVGQHYVLLLTDEMGVTVDYFGDENFKHELQTAGLYMGAEWSEQRAGTCGVGSCITTGKAITVHQGDHFDSTHTPLSCSAAPIYNSSGQLSAVLDISLLRSPAPKVSQDLALHMVKSASRRIEQSGLMHELRGEWVLSLSRSPAMVDVDPEHSIALDGSGRLIGMTHSAAKLLARQSGQSWRRPEKLIGQRIQRFFHLGIDELPRLTRAFPAQQRRLVARDNSIWYGHAIDPAYGHSLKRTVVAVDQMSTVKQVQLPAPLARLSGGDKQLDKMLRRTAKLSQTQLPILLQGETGTGKEYLARAIHAVSRPDKPFVAINCAAIPASLIEGELFGHAPGAFTGAARHGRAGLIEAADGGTLFLDEIGDMPLELQTRLLRVLSEGETVRVGAVVPRSVDVRVLSASLHHLPQLVQEGRFRSDLYYRISGAELPLPPLREREDLPVLAQSILRKHSSEAQLCTQALERLSSYSWPGNLRELDNVLQLAIALAEDDLIRVDDLPSKVRAGNVVARGSTPTQCSPNSSEMSTSKDSTAALHEAIDRHGGNMSRAAKALGINRSTLYRRLKRSR